MAYNTLKVITNAYYLSGIVARDLETVSGSQVSDGLSAMNKLLSNKSINNRLIPFFKSSNFTAVIGQEQYTIDNLLEVETLTFNYNNVRYPMEQLSREVYFGLPRANQISSLPVSFHVERKLNGSNLWMYFLPNQAYVFTIWGKFGFDSVTLMQDLSLTFELNYLNYLEFLLAEYICMVNGQSLPEMVKQELRAYENQFQTVSPIDLSTRKKSTLQRNDVLNWGMANLSGGWTTNG